MADFVFLGQIRRIGRIRRIGLIGEIMAQNLHISEKNTNFATKNEEVIYYSAPRNEARAAACVLCAVQFRHRGMVVRT